MNDSRRDRFDAWVRRVGEDPDPRFTLANERTFLAWITTSLGLLGMGLAVGSLVPQESWKLTVIAALWILLSAVLALRALWRWFRLERAMREGRGLPLSRSIPLVALGVGLLSVASWAALVAAR
jgi:putative membrane protein